jgi:hypothetical protein
MPLAFGLHMARGWESKSVEAQQEEASRAQGKAPKLTREEAAREEKRRALQLARKRAVADLARASAAAHRSMLEQAITSLDKQLAEL